MGSIIQSTRKLVDKNKNLWQGIATHIVGAAPASKVPNIGAERGFLVCIVRVAGLPRGPGRSYEREYNSGFFIALNSNT